MKPVIELVCVGWPQGEAINRSWAENELRWFRREERSAEDPANSSSAAKDLQRQREMQALQQPFGGCSGNCGKLDICDVVLSQVFQAQRVRLRLPEHRAPAELGGKIPSPSG